MSKIVRPRVQVSFEGDPGLTKQSFMDECDINNIMFKYQVDGLISHVSDHEGRYGDFTSVQDYQTSMNQCILARDMFMTLPSSVRIKFANDPANFLEFVSDSANRDEMKLMGLLKPELSAALSAPLQAPIEDSTLV